MFHLLTHEYLTKRPVIKGVYFLCIYSIIAVFVYFISPLGWNVLVSSAVGALFINSSIKNYLKSLDITLSVFVYLSILVNCVSGIVFLISPELMMTWPFIFIIIITVGFLILTFFIKANKGVFLSPPNNILLLYFNVFFKALLLFMVTVLVPMLFPEIGVPYFIMLLSFGFIMIFASFYMRYVFGIESEKKKIEIEFTSLQTEAENVNKKHNEVITFKHYYSAVYRSIITLVKQGDIEGLEEYCNEYITPIHENLIKELEDYSQIEHIRLPLVKYRINELVNAVSRLPNVDLLIAVDNIIDDLAIKEMDLFTIISIFVDNAIEEVQSHDKATIAVYMNKMPEGFMLTIGNSLKGYESTDKPQNTHKGMEIVDETTSVYPNVFINTEVKLNWFMQCIEVMND